MMCVIKIWQLVKTLHFVTYPFSLVFEEEGLENLMEAKLKRS